MPQRPDWSTYGKRLADALAYRKRSRKDLAAALRSQKTGEMGVSVQAVGQVLTGEGTLSAENHMRAARYLHVDPWWLVSGEGNPGYQAQEVLPFEDLRGLEVQLITFFRDLPTDALRDEVVVRMNNLRNEPGRADAANPFPQKTGRRRGISVFDDLTDESQPKKSTHR